MRDLCVDERRRFTVSAVINFGAVILAAGGSSRLGQPKQLLVWRGKPLIVRAVEAVLGADVAPENVAVVVGASAGAVCEALGGLPVRVVENAGWREGMGSSIRAGVAALKGTDAVLIALCDQPFFDAESARRLLAAWEGVADAFRTKGGLIVASRYEGRVGAPAVFGKEHHLALLSLSGDRGAAGYVLLHKENVVSVDFPEFATDVDTPGDWGALIG